MKPLVKESFEILITEGIQEYEKFVRDHFRRDPTDADQRIKSKDARQLLENASDRTANKTLRDLLKGTPVTNIDPNVRNAFDYLRWVDEQGLTHEGWRKALSISSLEEQCDVLGIPIEKIAFGGSKTDLESRVARCFAPRESAIFYKPYRILLTLRVVSTSALIDHLLANPDSSDRIKHLAARRDIIDLEVDTLTNFRGRMDEEAPEMAERLGLDVSDVWQLSYEIQELQIEVIGDVFGSWDKFLWYFDNSHLSMATNVLDDEIQVKEQTAALWKAVGSYGIYRLVRDLVQDEIRESGWPDITFCLPGKLHCYEVKKGRDRLSYSQIRQIEYFQNTLPDLVPVIRVAKAG